MTGQTDERARDRPLAQDAGEAQDDVDRQLMRRTRGVGRVAREIGERAADHGPGLGAGDRVDDDAGRVGRQVGEVVDAQLLAAAHLELGEQVARQGRQERGQGHDRGAVVAPVGVAAGHDPDGRGRQVRGHRTVSTTRSRSMRRSRKWVAHEMHGS